EVERTLRAFETAVAHADAVDTRRSWVHGIASAPGADRAGTGAAAVPSAGAAAQGREREGTVQTASRRSRGPRPAVPPGRSIDAYSCTELLAMADWVMSDGLLRTYREIVAELTRELGF